MKKEEAKAYVRSVIQYARKREVFTTYKEIEKVYMWLLFVTFLVVIQNHFNGNHFVVFNVSMLGIVLFMLAIEQYIGKQLQIRYHKNGTLDESEHQEQERVLIATTKEYGVLQTLNIPKQETDGDTLLKLAKKLYRREVRVPASNQVIFCIFIIDMCLAFLGAVSVQIQAIGESVFTIVYIGLWIQVTKKRKDLLHCSYKDMHYLVPYDLIEPNEIKQELEKIKKKKRRNK